MLRVTFVASSLPHGGAERLAITLMTRLAHRRHECHALAIRPATGPLDGIPPRRLISLDAATFLDQRALREFADHLARLRPHAVVAANPYALLYAWLALRLARVHARLVATFHSTRLLGAKERLLMLAYRPLFWSSDALVFVCERQKRYWLPRGVCSRRNEVIHNGVDTDAFRDRWDAVKRAALRASLGFGAADYVVGVSAILRPEKNHVQMVEAIAELRRRGIPARALFVGDGDTRAAIEARARDLGVAGDVVITGLVDDVRPCLAACDVVALCSLSETFSLAALEAMALGRPVVHSEVGGAAEMIVPGVNGFLFPAGNTPALVACLAPLADRTRARAVGARARRLVEQRFSETAMVERYEQLLLDLCREKLEAAAHAT